MTGRHAALVLAVALAACQSQVSVRSMAPVTDERAFGLARARLMENLKDPGSARVDPRMIRKISGWMSGSADVVCGRVNAKNSFGGYVGTMNFVYFIERDQIYVDGPGYTTAAIACQE